MQVLDAREPRAFFCTFPPEDYDGSIEWTPRTSRPSLGLEFAPRQLLGNAGVAVLPQQDILTINDNGGEQGFEFQQLLRNGQQVAGAYIGLPEAERPNFMGVAGPPYRVALLSRRRTDSLLVDVYDWPAGVQADPTTVEGRAAWYSLAFCLRTAATTYLDVDTQELDAGFRTWPREEGAGTQARRVPAGQAFLCDRLENGAGYCAFLARPEHFVRLLQQADRTQADSIAARWLGGDHGGECDTSCNLCLRDFYNGPYHGLLDWRLALDMARLAGTGDIPDLVSPWQGQPNPWQRLVDPALPGAPVPAILQRLRYQPPVPLGSLRGYHRPHARAAHRVVLIERHPLWTDAQPAYQAAVAAAAQQFPGVPVRALNPFILLRRPADYA
jgi:hypothetical protein